MSKDFLQALDVELKLYTEIKKIPLPRDLGKVGKVNFLCSIITFGLFTLQWAIGILSAGVQTLWVIRFNKSGAGKARKSFIRANHAIKKEEYEKAADYYEAALRDSPKTTAIYPILGDVYLKMGQEKRGVDIYKKYLEAHPQDRIIQIKLLVILIEYQMYKEALALLESLPEELTKDYLLSVIKTFAQIVTNQPELARKTLQSISPDELEGEGKAAPINYLLGRIFFAEGKKSEAKPCFEKALEQKNDFFDTKALLTK